MIGMYRTDLALEAKELWETSPDRASALQGVKGTETKVDGYTVSRVDILDERGEKALGKKRGSYRTVDLSPYWEDRAGAFSAAAALLARQLRQLLPQEGSVFVAGLGNRGLTPDAIGPLAVEHLLITRHLSGMLPGFRPLSAAAAGVLGTTGLESSEWVRSLAEHSEAKAVIVIDALAARSLDRLCTAVQISDTGIVPGSGIGNARMALDRESMGVPVIAVGVPTVVDALTLAADLLGEGAVFPENVENRGRSLFVTPKDVDSKVRQLGKLIGYGVNLAVQRQLTVEDVAALLE